MKPTARITVDAESVTEAVADMLAKPIYGASPYTTEHCAFVEELEQIIAEWRVGKGEHDATRARMRAHSAAVSTP